MIACKQVNEYVVARYAASRFIGLARALTKRANSEVKLVVCQECGVQLSDLILDMTYPLKIEEAVELYKEEAHINAWLQENGCKQAWEKGLTVDELTVIKTIAKRFLSVARSIVKHIDDDTLEFVCRIYDVNITDVVRDHDYPFTLEEAVRTHDYANTCFWLNNNGYGIWSLSQKAYKSMKKAQRN